MINPPKTIKENGITFEKHTKVNPRDHAQELPGNIVVLQLKHAFNGQPITITYHNSILRQQTSKYRFQPEDKALDPRAIIYSFKEAGQGDYKREYDPPEADPRQRFLE